MIVPIEIRQPVVKRYDIVIDELPELKYDRKVAIVTNTTVAPLHLERVLQITPFVRRLKSKWRLPFLSTDVDDYLLENIRHPKLLVPVEMG